MRFQSTRFKTVFTLGVISILFTFSSCSNLEIVKRRYRPGYHVSKAGKSEDQGLERSTVLSKRSEVEHQAPKPYLSQATTTLIEHQTPIPEPVIAPTSVESTVSPEASASSVPELYMQTFQHSMFQSNRKSLSGEFVRAVGIEPEEEKQAWNPYGFVGLGFGTLALVMVVIGGVHLMRYNPPPGSGFYFLGAGIGIALAVTLGIVGLKKKSIRNKKGRGFAFASWGSGALAGLALILVGLMYVIWQLSRAF